MMDLVRRPIEAAIIAMLATGCASHYAYTFHVTDPAVRVATAPGAADTVEDANLRAAVLVDPVAEAVRLELTNKTDEVLQIGWSEISFSRPDGTATAWRPDVDVGWLQPGATIAARLLPLALPHVGTAAAANEGRAFRLDVPAIVRREATVYHFTLTAHVRKL